MIDVILGAAAGAGGGCLAGGLRRTPRRDRPTSRRRLALLNAKRHLLLPSLLILLLGTCGRAQVSPLEDTQGQMPREAAANGPKLDVTAFFALPDNYRSPAERLTLKAFRAPWIEDSQVRTETRDFDPQSQRYTLRLSPNSPGKARAQTALANLLDNRPDFDEEDAACDRLRQRYEDWLDLYLIDEETALINRLDTVLQDRKTVLERMSARLNFDWSELVNLLKQRSDLDIRQLALLEKRDQLLAANGIPAANFDFSGFPAPEQLIRSMTSGGIVRNDAETTYEYETVVSELALEQAENRQYLDFVQAEYNGPHDDPFRERFSVGVGFQFPSGGNQQLKVRELQLEARELLNKQETESAEQLLRYGLRRTELNGALAYYNRINELLAAENEELGRIADRISAREGFNPLPLLSIQERKIKNALRELAGRQDLLEGYLDAREEAICTLPEGELWR